MVHLHGLSLSIESVADGNETRDGAVGSKGLELHLVQCLNCASTDSRKVRSNLKDGLMSLGRTCIGPGPRLLLHHLGHLRLSTLQQ